MVKWEVLDELKAHRNDAPLPQWWGLKGAQFKELSRETLGPKAVKFTVDVLANFNDDGTPHWANDSAKQA